MKQTIANRRNKFIAFLVIFVGIALFQFTELRYIFGILNIVGVYHSVVYWFVLGLTKGLTYKNA